jgi:hypothetical protein
MLRMKEKVNGGANEGGEEEEDEGCFREAGRIARSLRPVFIPGLLRQRGVSRFVGRQRR